jgi:hypothetical protein
MTVATCLVYYQVRQKPPLVTHARDRFPNLPNLASSTTGRGRVLAKGSYLTTTDCQDWPFVQCCCNSRLC